MVYGRTMRPTLLPRLPNGRTGDPALLVEAPGLGLSVLFDCGDLSALSPRQLLRVAVLGLSHAHMDHWADVDRLLRVRIGQAARLDVLGPPGTAARLHHRLLSYTWNLVDRIAAELVIEATEIGASGPVARRRFRLRSGFAEEALPVAPAPDGVAWRSGPLSIRAALLDHGTPCLGFLLEEASHANICAAGLTAAGLPAGPWLAGLKAAIAAGLPDDHPVPVFARPAEAAGAPCRPLGALRGLVRITPGQRIGYLTDLGDTPANRAAAVALVSGADTLFVEAPFPATEAARAADRHHLTTIAAGEIARAAGVKRVEPFHISPRHAGEEARLLAEVAAAAGLPVPKPGGPNALHADPAAPPA